MAYRLDLPASSKVHHVFHVSLLRQVLKPSHQVYRAFLRPTPPYKYLNKFFNAVWFIVVTRRWSRCFSSGRATQQISLLGKISKRSSNDSLTLWLGGKPYLNRGIVSDKEKVTREAASGSNRRPTRKPGMGLDPCKHISRIPIACEWTGVGERLVGQAWKASSSSSSRSPPLETFRVACIENQWQNSEIFTRRHPRRGP